MADATADEEKARPKPSGLWLIAGIFLAIAGGAGGFYAVRAGLLPGNPGRGESQAETPTDPPAQGDVSTPVFVAMEPMIISLGEDGNARHLKFRADFEVAPEHRQEVEQMMPRIIDVLNGYLRALKPSDLSDPMALTRLRAQMLRRVRIVAGKGRVRDLLIMEFVLN